MKWIFIFILCPITLWGQGNLFIRGFVNNTSANAGVGTTMHLVGPGAGAATQCPANVGAGATAYSPVTIVSPTEATNVTVTSNGPGAGFCFNSMSNGTYTITPVKTGYTFIAADLTFQVLNTDTIIQAYFYPTTAGTTTFNLQGGANDAAGASVCIDQPSCLPYAIPGVTISLTGTVELTGTTNSAGIYNFNVPNGYYHLTASAPNYVFVPAYSTVLISNAGAGRSAAYASQFWGAQVGTGSHNITGEILGPTSGPVTITLSGQQSATTTTDASGYFTFSNMPAGNYTLTPSLAGYTFGPASASVTLVQYDSVTNTFVVLSPPNPAPPPITGTPNILVNHTFDLYGPQCNTFWDSSQGWFPYITTDSHSGTYALEIACKETGKCTGQNPYIVTGGVPVPTPGKIYSFTGWGKCGGPIATTIFNTLFYVQSAGNTAFAVGGSTPTNITCDNVWHQATFNINSGSEKAFNIGFMTNRTTPSTEQPAKVDDLTLTYSDGTAPPWNVWRHPGRRNVYVTPQELFVDGKPYLALGTYAAPVWDYPAVASLGINTIASASTTGTTPTPECYNLDPGSIMDTAYENGLNMLGDVTFASRVGLDDGTLHEAGSGGVLVIGNYTKQYSAHLANIGWFVDEPDLTAYDWYVIAPPMFIQFGNAIRSDSPLPLITDFQGAHYKGMAYMHAYNGSAAMWETETYGAFAALGNALYNLEAVQQRPAWFFQGSPNTGGDQGYWSALAKSYYGLIIGMRGIMYFAWNGFHATGSHCAGNSLNATCTSLGDDVLFMNFITQASAELKSLTDPILSGTPIPGFKVVGGPAAMASTYHGQTFILSVTPVGGNYTANFTVPGLAASTPITVQFENRTITSAAGSFTDTFTGQVRHVYVIGRAANAPAILNVGRIGP